MIIIKLNVWQTAIHNNETGRILIKILNNGRMLIIILNLKHAYHNIYTEKKLIPVIDTARMLIMRLSTGGMQITILEECLS